MRNNKTARNARTATIISASLLLAALGSQIAQAYQTYNGCQPCHGDFRGSTSSKGTVFPGNNNHDMHRNSANMGTACNLCHTSGTYGTVYIGSSTGTVNNQGRGCTGCHVGAGLQAHHVVRGVSECLDCHSAHTPPPENVKPPYYGTADTKARNPGNEVKVTNTNENWSVGDFLGLDNDGNNLYDLADYAIGPFRLLSVEAEGNNVRITWLTAGGRTNAVLASRTVSGSYSTISPAIGIPGVGLATNSYLEMGGATNPARFYRLRSW